MHLTIRYFAAAREIAGRASEPVEVPEGARLSDVRAALASRHPGLGGLSLRLALGERFAPPEQRVADGDVVAVIPPVSGG